MIQLLTCVGDKLLFEQQCNNSRVQLDMHTFLLTPARSYQVHVSGHVFKIRGSSMDVALHCVRACHLANHSVSLNGFCCSNEYHNHPSPGILQYYTLICCTILIWIYSYCCLRRKTVENNAIRIYVLKIWICGLWYEHKKRQLNFHH